MRVNEIFYSIQGEGAFTGTPAVFVRLSGCNLKCDFCDTEHLSHTEMSEDEIVAEVIKHPTKHVVITGGEPLLQLSFELISKLHSENRFIQLETNGTLPLGKTYFMFDWVTCSPKFDFCKNAELKIERIDELKVVYVSQDMSVYDGIQASKYYLQPCDTKDNERNAQNIAETIEFIKQNPKWKLSLQTQKILNVR